ncbi:MAG: hypothetical protein ACOZNI_16350 [Myxococcota bacterium]
MLLALFVACYSASGPCQDYCDYICDCHPELDCDGCYTEYGSADPALQDECEEALLDQQDADAAEGLECGADTGA